MSERSSRPAPVGDGPRAVAAVILAAGRGTRMNCQRPKVLHEVAGRPMVHWVVQAARASGARPVVLVVGADAEALRASVSEVDPEVQFAVQAEPKGTGHATACARAALEDFHGDVVVLAGDGPLVRARTIAALVDRHRQTDAAATLATSTIPDPTGYGRIVRDADGRFRAIVEERHATEAQREIREIYPSYACFDARLLFDALEHLRPNGETGEYYVTEVPAVLRGRGHAVELVEAVPPEDVLSINTPEQLAEVDAILSARLEAHA